MMLLDSKKRLKAKRYKVVTIDKSTHLIRPEGAETETVEIDPVQLVMDFSALISEYAKCKHLMVWHFPQSYAGISSKEGQNKIASLNAHIFKEQAMMEDALLEFINKYGLFGLLNDEAVGFDYNAQQADGSMVVRQYPVSAIVPDHEGLGFSVVPYDEYIQPYFPEVPASEAITLKGEARICQYAECMEDILQNKRISACAEYIAGIDKQYNSPLIIQNLNAALAFKGEVPVYDIQYKSLIEYCHSMFFLNEIAGEEKTVRICQYKRCHRPFTGRKAKYCCEACMRYANKARKKGDQNNG